MQRLLIVLGIVLVVVGLAWPFLARLPSGRLPGDLIISRPNFHLYFPLASMVIFSILLSLLLWLLRK